MITKGKLREMAQYSYERGVKLYYQDSVTEFQIEDETPFDRIEAVVRGSGRNSYMVGLSVNRDTDEVTESYCECPAYLSYSGLCKHCVAVMMKYIAQRQREELAETFRRRRETVGGDAAPQIRRRERQTTGQMKELLQRQIVRHTLPVLQGDSYGKIQLDPILTCTRGACQVEFRIGLKKKYVLKNVGEFAEAMRKGTDLAYGKNLQFVHVTESFDPQSRKLAAFILEWMDRYESAYRQYHPYLMYSSLSFRIREMQLDSWGIESFLEAVGDRPFLADVNGTGEKEWRVTGKTLRRQLYFRGLPDGMEITVDPLFGYDCERYFIFFCNGLIYPVQKEKLGTAGEFFSCMREIPQKTAFIQKADMPAFFRQIMPALRETCDCVMQNVTEEEAYLSSPTFRFYLDMPQEDFLSCRAMAVYGEKEYNVYDPSSDLERRDIWKEAEIGKVVSACCGVYDEKKKTMGIGEGEPAFYEFLTEGAARLRQYGEVYVSDAIKRIRVLPSPKVSVGLSLAGDLLDLSVTSQDLSREQLAEILSRYNRRRRYYRLRNGDIVRTDGEDWHSLYEVQKALQLSERQWKKERIELPRYRAFNLEDALKEGQSLSVKKDEGFRALISGMRTVEENNFAVPPALEGVMREYQKYGYRWIRTLCHNGFGGILADDMGLGKTLQVICFLLSEMGPQAGEGQPSGDKSALIVCPASLVYNWQKELERFAPGLPVRVITGTAAERGEKLKRVLRGEVVITSYDLLRRDVELYEGISFFCQVIDEAQYIKNQGTQAAKAVKQVRASFRLALTGTPVENRLSELWSIFDYLMPGYLYSYQRFREELERPVWEGEEETAARLQKMIRPFVLRRLKQEVLKELPDKLEENRYAVMEKEQQELYDAHVKRIQLWLDKESEEEFRHSKLQILAELTRLRQLCCDPALLYENYQGGSAKQEMAMALVKNAVGNNHKVLLFSQFTSMLDRLAQSLQEAHIPYYMLTGATPKERRAQMVEEFSFDAVPVFCISLKAGGTGLNLTAADVVIHFDPWWNVAVQNQATDRAHRIGQTNTVNVYRLIAKGTIEEKIVELQEKKQELADKILGGSGLKSGSLTKEELLELLR